MSKKYKLIKEYPDSVKLGTEISLSNFEDTGTFVCQDGGWKLIPHSHLASKEYWQQIVEKEYEILSFRCIDSQYKQAIGKVYTDCQLSEEVLRSYLRLVEEKKSEIYSVKRLSDGETFTIGDRFINQYNKESEITGFSLISNYIDIRFFINGGNYGITLKDIKRFKQPLFTTEDGVDIFDKEIHLYIVEKNYHLLPGTIQAKYCFAINYKLFLDYSKAVEYIIMNTPCLSANDIIAKGYIPSNVIIELVKSKLKL